MDRSARADKLWHVPPEAGAIVFVRYAHAINSTRLVERLRDEQSVLVVPGDHFEMDGYLRIGFGGVPADLIGEPRANRRDAGFAAAHRRRCALTSRSSASATSGGASSGCSTSSAIACARDHDLECRVVGIATRRHGAVFDASGLPATLTDDLDAGAERSGASRSAALGGGALGLIDALARSGAEVPVVVETTTLDIEAASPRSITSRRRSTPAATS